VGESTGVGDNVAVGEKSGVGERVGVGSPGPDVKNPSIDAHLS